MRISLYQLNESWPALARLANREFPKEQHKLAYKIARVYKQAKVEVETMGESLNILMGRCGFHPGERDVEPAKIQDFNQQFRKFLRETEIEFTWGDPIQYEDLRDHVTLTPADLAELDWLVEDGARGA